jgi:hypothetical protein
MTGAERIAFMHGREVVRRRRDAEARARFAAWEAARVRNAARGFSDAQYNEARTVVELKSPLVQVSVNVGRNGA